MSGRAQLVRTGRDDPAALSSLAGDDPGTETTALAHTAPARLISATDMVRALLGWGAVAALWLIRPLLTTPMPAVGLVVGLAAIVGVIIVCAFGVVTQAEALARRLGDPYGTLVLTLSIVLIEVVLIAAVLLGPGEHSTIARDSVMAVSMIIMNLVIGLSLLLGGLRHGAMAHNRTGTSAYLSMLILLSALAFALPALISEDGAYTAGQASSVIALTLALYAFFLYRQTGAQAREFQEVEEAPVRHPRARSDERRPPIGEVWSTHRREVLTRLLLLVITMIPIVLLAQHMAVLLDDGLGRLNAPVALAGVLIAMIVFLPESLTSVRAALFGEIQRVSNLCHGALVSTVGITIPAVLAIGLLTGQTVILAESPANLLLLGVTMLLSVATFAAPRVTATHGAVHLAVFAAYGLVLFS